MGLWFCLSPLCIAFKYTVYAHIMLLLQVFQLNWIVLYCYQLCFVWDDDDACHVLLLKAVVSQSVGDFESSWQRVSEQFSQRRSWINDLDAKLTAAEDTRVDGVLECLLMLLAILGPDLQNFVKCTYENVMRELRIVL